MKNLVVLDCEVYPNYTLFAFRNIDKDNLVTIEIKGEDSTLSNGQRKKLYSIMGQRVTFGFNSNNYDIPVILYALQNKSAKDICRLSNYIIENNSPSWKTLSNFGLQLPVIFDHFDISEVAPGVKTSLKLYGGRIHSKKLQDLPIEPNSRLSEKEMEDTKLYCNNDLQTTIDLYDHIKERVALRYKMSNEYQQDLRSKSDAQIAEIVIKSELTKGTGKRLYAPKLPANTTFKYKAPGYIKFNDPQLQEILEIVNNYNFELDGKGSVRLPNELKKAKIKIGESIYQMGIGGIHSTEKKQTIIAREDQMLVDRDVAAYYPNLILNGGLYPKQLGTKFLEVYKNIVDKRLKAKREGDKIVNESLKIVINGSFGKLGSKYSALYSPDLMLAVTLTGQLSLLMLIEQLEEKGICVISANTDGFVSLLNKSQYQLYNAICLDWELETELSLEETRYKALYSRDVNNYLAVLEDGKNKGKGIFTLDSISKNPQAPICVEAVIAHLTKGQSLESYIKDCKDLTKFLTVRTARTGAVWEGQYLGRVVRWIYSTNGSAIRVRQKYDLKGHTYSELASHFETIIRNDVEELRRKSLIGYSPKYQGEEGELLYDKQFEEEVQNRLSTQIRLMKQNLGAKVAKSDGARPIMELGEFAEDIDYNRYIQEAQDILTNLGLQK